MREKSEWHLQPNTQDEFVVEEVYYGNCYQIEDDLSGKVVIDIGANIGAFTILCLERGAECVYAVEMDMRNYSCLIRNLPVAPAVHGWNCAAVEDFCEHSTMRIPGEYLAVVEGGDVLQTGGKSLFFGSSDGEYVETVKISSVLSRARSHEKPIILKLDCEGYEYVLLDSIAKSSLGFAGIESIVLECHELSDGKISLRGEQLPPEIASIAAQRMQSPEWVKNLLEDAGFKVRIQRNPDDPHLSLVFADRRKTVAMLTPVRSARKYLPRFFRQVNALRESLKASGYGFRLVLAEGDSEDGTRERLQEYCQELDLDFELLDVSHGGMRWQSVEDPARMLAMSKVMNAALGTVKSSDDIVIWGMIDTEWSADDLLAMVDYADSNPGAIFAPMVLLRQLRVFYDTWAFRTLDGERFKAWPPYDNFEAGGLCAISSAGTCLVMNADIARNCRSVAQEAVSFCLDARLKGYVIVLGTSWEVFHSEPTNRRLLWIGDALVYTGYARVTHAMLPQLAEAGFDIDVIGLNYYGTPHNLPYRIWPAAQRFNQDPRGVLRMKQLIYSCAYDVVVVLCDPWNVKAYQDALEEVRESVKSLPVLIPWLTVDSGNQQWESIKCENLLFSSGNTELERDLRNTICYGVDTSIFRPLDRAECRKFSIVEDKIPADAYIVGSVLKNQYRKRVDLTLQAFADWIQRYRISDAYLYIFISGQAAGGFDIEKLSRYFGLEGRVVTAYVENSVDDHSLARVYNSFDAYLDTSQAEGFGLTLLEAMACGVPVITSDQGGRTWIPQDCAMKLGATNLAISAPLDDLLYTVGATPPVDQISSSLNMLYKFPHMRGQLSRNGQELAARMTWKHTGESLSAAISEILDRKELQSVAA